MIDRHSKLFLHSWTILATAMLLCIASSQTYGQRLNELVIGARIRIIASDSVWVGTILAKRLRTIGVYQGSSASDVHVKNSIADDTTKIARRLIRTVHVSVARRSRRAGAAKGALIGFGVGIATTLMAALIPASTYGMKGETDLKNVTALLLGIPFTLVSTISTATALSFHQDRWKEVEMLQSAP